MSNDTLIKIERVEGRGCVVRGDDVDTDRIIPARFMKEVTFDTMGEHAFEDARKDAKGEHPLDQERFQGASILVVGQNFGCGSSREHAPQALMRFGFGAFIGGSFAEIFFGNCTALGLPCVTLSSDDLGSKVIEIVGDVERGSGEGGRQERRRREGQAWEVRQELEDEHNVSTDKITDFNVNSSIL